MTSFQKKQILIDAKYLIDISKYVDMLNQQYQRQQIGSLSNQFRHLLMTSFTKLNQNTQTYLSSIDSKSMIQAAVIKCRSEIQIFCLEKISKLLANHVEEEYDQMENSIDIRSAILKIAEYYKQNMEDFQKVLLDERRKRVQYAENQRDLTINKLKQELAYRKQYIIQLKQYIKDLQLQNTKLHEKLILNAKNLSDKSLSISPRKKSILSPSILNKLKSQDLLGIHNIPSLKQVQQTIYDIMQTKKKQQKIKGKKMGMKNFINTYFRYKFGMKDLAIQLQLKFKDTLQKFCQNQKKYIFLLFMKIYEEVCDEDFFWKIKQFQKDIIKIAKRYINQVNGTTLDEIDNVFQKKPINQQTIQGIIVNIYKTADESELQIILHQIMIERIQKQLPLYQKYQIPSKQLINQILNYQLNNHLVKIQDIVRQIIDIDNGRGYLNWEDVGSIIQKLNINGDQIIISQEFDRSCKGKYFTSSETIQLIQKLRRNKIKKK